EEWTSITSVSTSIFLKMAENNFVRQKRPDRIVNLLSKTSSGDRSGLIVRRRGYKRVPLKPLVFGGGQERGLRPGTLPVALIAGLGEAAAVAFRDNQERKEKCLRIREEALAALSPLKPKFNGDLSKTMEHVLNLSLPGIDSEALIVALKGLAAISNGSACTSSNYTPSHVLTAMGQTEDEANEGIRISWCHLTEAVDWKGIAERISSLR
ncbi:MAG: hypothetical protein P1U90_14185, partial [Akkermansiaceae bacterium]|nr:hypothetical protein [Akkermansiaceae bacterium]